MPNPYDRTDLSDIRQAISAVGSRESYLDCLAQDAVAVQVFRARWADARFEGAAAKRNAVHQLLHALDLENCWDFKFLEEAPTDG